MNEEKNLTAPGIDLDDGKISVSIRNQFGEETGVFRFDPTDIRMVDRYNEKVNEFKNVLQPLIDGKAKGADPLQAMNEAGDRIIELLDYVLGGDSREAFFKTRHPLSPRGGVFYAETVMEKVGKLIEQSFEGEIKKMNLRMKKHTDGYKTGVHKRG